MSIFYQLLGLVAMLNRRMSRFRVNFVPINLAVMAGLAFLLFLSVGEIHDGIVNGSTPIPLTLAQVLNHTDTHNYVTVQGEMHPEARLQYGDASPGQGESEPLNRIDQTWVPMLDRQSHRVLLVETASNEMSSQPNTETVTGMLRPMSSKISDELNKDGGMINNTPVDMTSVLVEGQQPHSPWLWMLIAALSGLMLAAMLYTMATRYVVFQPTARIAVAPSANPWSGAISSTPGTFQPASPVATNAMSGLAPQNMAPAAGSMANSGATSANNPGDNRVPLDLRVTGRYALSGNVSRHFVEVPAMFGRTNGGDFVFGSNIDASSRFYGIKTNDRSGFWEILVPRADAHNLQSGRLYNGLAARPALRMNYTNNGRPATMIMSLGSEAERVRLLELFNAAAGGAIAS